MEFRSNVRKVAGMMLDIVSTVDDDVAITAGIRTAVRISEYLKTLDGHITVLDIGANVGSVAVVLGRMFGDSLIMHCVEPHPSLHECLVENISRHGLAGIVVPHRCAIGDFGYIDAGPNGHNTGKARTFRKAMQNTVAVDSYILDDFINRILGEAGHADVLKMDVEGGEYDILPNFTLWDRIDRYHVEYHVPTPEIAADEAYMRKHGLYDDYIQPMEMMKVYVMKRLGVSLKTVHERMI